MGHAIKDMEEALAKPKNKVKDTVSEKDPNEINAKDSKIIFATESGYEIPFLAKQVSERTGMQEISFFKNGSDYLQVLLIRTLGGNVLRENSHNLEKFKKIYEIEADVIESGRLA